jgi:general secretion pathway protein F
LAPLLDRAALQMENDADARLKAVVSLFEPILIVVMGGVIGMITLSIITPLFSIMQKI